jgi:DNA-binding MarR family transcriptional regulator
MAKITHADYRLLASFRYEMRKFLAFSEQAARDAGVEPQQHQMLLAVRGLPEGARPTIGTIAERLCVQHHTAVALADKLEERGFLRRERGLPDKREVLLHITSEGEALLRELSALHRQQLGVVGPALVSALEAILQHHAARRTDATRTARGPSTKTPATPRRRRASPRARGRGSDPAG